MLMDGFWHIFRIKDNKWSFNWPHLVATVKTRDGEFRNITPKVVEEIRDFCDIFGPRWRGNIPAWIKFIDAIEAGDKAEEDYKLEQALHEHFEPHIGKMRREFNQFTLPTGSYKQYMQDDYRGVYQQWGNSGPRMPHQSTSIYKRKY